ncbi:MAG TPA: hypothetical protein VGM51_04220 [Armatimonadota bacterium]|jgi:hypothetical protein
MKEETLSPEERERALGIIAERIRRYHLETPAILFLEINRPLADMAGLAAHSVTPLFGAFTGLDTAERYASLLGDKAALDSLINRLEESRDSRSARPDAKPGPPRQDLETRNSEPI